MTTWRTDIENWEPPPQTKCRLCEKSVFLKDGVTRPFDVFDNQPKTEDLVFVERSVLFDNNKRYNIRYVFCNTEHFHTYVSWDPSWRNEKPMSSPTDAPSLPLPAAPTVRGYCPFGCGETLNLDASGRVFCRNETCEDRYAIAEILNDEETEHVVDVDDANWTCKHPLRERIEDTVLTCEVTEYLSSALAAPVTPGRYRVTVTFGTWSWEKL